MFGKMFEIFGKTFMFKEAGVEVFQYGFMDGL